MRLRLIAHSAVPAYPGAYLGSTKVKPGDNENIGDRMHLTFSPEGN
jgi:hypothetical protein